MPPAVTNLQIGRGNTLRDALEKLDATGTGHLLLVDSEGRFERVVTDGDLRRLILAGGAQHDDLTSLPQVTPVVAAMDLPISELRALFEKHKVAAIPRLDADRRPRVLERREALDPIPLSTPHLGSDEAIFVQQAFDTNWIAPLGPNVEQFEQALAAYSGVGYVAALSSGTAAIHLGLLVLGLKDGDRAYCSSFTFAASANPIRYERAEPVFIDSEPGTWNMSPAALERALHHDRKRNTLPKVVIVANLYGQSADMKPIIELCDYHNVPVLEDAAESLGASYFGKRSGSFGKISAFSFNGNKIITTSGGGALCSDDEELVSRARFLATQAREPVAHYEHNQIGYNYRLSNVLAGIGCGQLNVLDARVSRRRAIFEAYAQGLVEVSGLEWMPEPAGYFSTRWLTAGTLRASGGLAPDALIDGLRVAGIEARKLWKPMHRQPVFRGCEYFQHAEDQSLSDDLFATGFCLPSGSNLTDSDVSRVVERVRFLLETR